MRPVEGDGISASITVQADIVSGSTAAAEVVEDNLVTTVVTTNGGC